ncbi:hypothetical protein [Gaopeijia maritima]|uniref:Uncharacterized protein n=1 Tax=Gaopeijia maritima TaxID=3119007 RepID=A0ABU9E4J1_9BACT
MKRLSLVTAAAALVLAGCGSSGPSQLPEPRPLIIQSGARLTPVDDVRMREVYDQVDDLMNVIITDPSFLISSDSDARDVYPWETLEIVPDTAYIRFQRTAPDVRDPYQIYAFLHLMREEGRIGDYLPEAEGVDDWTFELAAMKAVSDAWLLGRAYFDLAPYALLDEVMYASEAGYLPELLLALRPGEFEEARAGLDPVRVAAFEAWYRETFGEDPPGNA